MSESIFRLKPYIQPFERRLALEEMETLTGGRPVSVDGSGADGVLFAIQEGVDPRMLLERVAYWEASVSPVPSWSRQVLREATVNVVRNGVSLEEVRSQLPFEDSEAVPTPNRRALRYGTHGIHEYRGKFFPQLVRSLINISGTSPGGTVGDPMCGSGTTLVEAVLAGCHGIGLDMNPLSVFMSQVKCSSLFLEPEVLARKYQSLKERLPERKPGEVSDPLSYFGRLPNKDQEYLRRWFSEEALMELDRVSDEISSEPDEAIQGLMVLALSNILRSVSWQKDADLRVRKEIRPDEEVKPVRDFIEELGRSVRLVYSMVCQEGTNGLGSFHVKDGDARRAREAWGVPTESIDVIVTSPPYATALPYLDTDRLSLSYLRLLSRPNQRKRDFLMIGNREITQKQRQSLWERFQSDKGSLPVRVVRLIERVEKLNRHSDAGFRRKNLPSLLAKYFFDMKEVLRQMESLLKAGSPAYVVVGNNHTVAGGERVEIETGSLLVEIAESIGLLPGDHIPMEMLTPRDIFKRNAIATEDILVFKKAGQ